MYTISLGQFVLVGDANEVAYDIYHITLQQWGNPFSCSLYIMKKYREKKRSCLICIYNVVQCIYLLLASFVSYRE